MKKLMRQLSTAGWKGNKMKWFNIKNWNKAKQVKPVRPYDAYEDQNEIDQKGSTSFLSNRLWLILLAFIIAALFVRTGLVQSESVTLTQTDWTTESTDSNTTLPAADWEEYSVGDVGVVGAQQRHHALLLDQPLGFGPTSRRLAGGVGHHQLDPRAVMADKASTWAKRQVDIMGAIDDIRRRPHRRERRLPGHRAGPAQRIKHTDLDRSADLGRNIFGGRRRATGRQQQTCKRQPSANATRTQQETCDEDRSGYCSCRDANEP